MSSYQVLARKLRPVKFSQLIGQEYIARALKNSIIKDRVAHAFLFVGARGIGKTSCARILTKALNCTSINKGEPCNKCENCREINEGSCTDVFEIDAASNRGIEHIRDLRESIKYLPAKTNFKVYIIDEAHMLTVESFNALLKTLEEPPAHVKFILATTDPHKIPKTVVSRCQHYDFRPISISDISGYLKSISDQHTFKIDDKIINMIAINSMGGLRDALTALEMIFNFSDETTTNEEICEMLGWNDPNELMGLLEFIVHKNVEKALDTFNSMIMRGIALSQILSDLLKLTKDLSQLKETHKKGQNLPGYILKRVFDVNRFLALLERVGISQLTQYFGILMECELLIRKSSYAVPGMEMAIIKMCRVDKLVGLNELISLIKDQGSKKVNFEFKPSSEIPKPLNPGNNETLVNVEANPFYGKSEQAQQNSNEPGANAHQLSSEPPQDLSKKKTENNPIVEIKNVPSELPEKETLIGVVKAENTHETKTTAEDTAVKDTEPKQNDPPLPVRNPIVTEPNLNQNIEKNIEPEELIQPINHLQDIPRNNSESNLLFENPPNIENEAEQNESVETDLPVQANSNNLTFSKETSDNGKNQEVLESTHPIENNDGFTGTGYPPEIENETEQNEPYDIELADQLYSDSQRFSEVVRDEDEPNDTLESEQPTKINGGTDTENKMAAGEEEKPDEISDELYQQSYIDTYFKSGDLPVLKIWIEFIAFCQLSYFKIKENYYIRGALKTAVPLEYNKNIFTVGVSPYSVLNTDKAVVLPQVNRWISEFFRSETELEFRTGNNEMALNAKKYEQTILELKLENVKKEFMAQPHVQELMSLFKNATVKLNPIN